MPSCHTSWVGYTHQFSPTRYDLGEEHAREKDRYAAKERDEVIRKSKERRLADTKVHSTVDVHIHVLRACAGGLQ